MQRSNTTNGDAVESCSQKSVSGGNNKMLMLSTSPSCTSDTSTLVPRLIAGSIGSIVTALAVTPLEVVKIRQQIDAAGAASSISSSSPSSLLFRGVKIGPSTTCPGCGTILLNNGLMDCVLPIESTMMSLKSSSSPTTTTMSGGAIPKSGGSSIVGTLVSIFRNEGISSLYVGLRPTLAMSVPNTVLYFTAYDEISIRLRQYHANNHHHLAAERQSNRNNSSNNSGGRTIMSGEQQAYIPLVAGSTARLLATMATAPLELIRTRQASVAATATAAAIKRDGCATTNAKSPIAIPGMLEEFKVLTRTRGISSLYAGLAPTLWRDVPFSAFYWLFFERFRNALSHADYSSEETRRTASTLLGQWSGGAYYRERGMKLPPSLEAMHSFVAGAAAGSIAAALTTPFDVVKTRQQMVGGNGEATVYNNNNIVVEGAEYHCGRQACAESIHPGRPLTSTTTAAVTSSTRTVGTFGYMHQIVQNEGLSALWKGNVTRMVKIAPACAIMISCYELGKRVFEV